MITGITIKNGIIRLILTGSDEIDREVLKRLQGGKVTFVSENLRVGETLITGGLVIEEGGTAEKEHSAKEPQTLTTEE
jgi:hypothetical protein